MNIDTGDADIGNTFRHILGDINWSDKQHLNLRVNRLCDQLPRRTHLNMNAGPVHQIIDRLGDSSLIRDSKPDFG